VLAPHHAQLRDIRIWHWHANSPSDPICYIRVMIKVLEDALDKVRRLPADRQAYVAEVLEQIAAAGDDLLIVPEGHRAAVHEGLEQAERGEFVSDEDMATLWKKCGL
jgi:predicted transcriptional regulator